MPVSKRLRYEILRRDNHTCRYCGATAPDVKLTVDHVVPTTLGGTDDPTNLVTACTACNAGKSSTNPDAPLVADVTNDALRFRQAVELAASLAKRDHDAIAAKVGPLLEEWPNRWTNAGYTTPPAAPAIDAWSVLGDLISRGLPTLAAVDLMDVTIAKYERDRYFPASSLWPYFIGCCRNKVADIEQTAKRLIDEGQV